MKYNYGILRPAIGLLESATFRKEEVHYWSKNLDNQHILRQNIFAVNFFQVDTRFTRLVNYFLKHINLYLSFIGETCDSIL